MNSDLVDQFENSFEPMRRAAYRAAYRLIGEREAAEDVAAEALARAYARWPAVCDHAEAWATVVATNLALDVGRRRATASERQRLLIDAPAADQVERRLDLQAALRALPRRQREVVVLRFLGDFSERATAAALALDVGTVKSHAARGLSRLRTTVERV